MKRLISSLIAIFACTAILILLTTPKRALPKVHAEDDAEACTAATLNGPYGLTLTGTIVGVGPLAIVGVATFDGERNISVTQTANVNGNAFPEHETGTYTVSSNCTGSSTVGGHGANFVILAGGREQILIGTDHGTVLTGTFKKMFPGHGDKD
jgi:hypothetical protein